MIFSSGGSGGGTQLRPMERGDFGAVLRIISSHDEDDFEEAREELRDDFEGMFVLTERGKVVGVTGAHLDPHSEDVVWLSWTYVDVARQGNGLGRTMIEQLLEMLRADGMRELFINTSDHREDAVDTYAAARAFYEKMGARLEVALRAYHTDREARLTYGLDLAAPPCSHRAPHRRRPAFHRYRAFARKRRRPWPRLGRSRKRRLTRHRRPWTRALGR
jgi:GNAT superfamily N-acetyltransferase